MKGLIGSIIVGFLIGIIPVMIFYYQRKIEDFCDGDKDYAMCVCTTKYVAWHLPWSEKINYIKRLHGVDVEWNSELNVQSIGVAAWAHCLIN